MLGNALMGAQFTVTSMIGMITLAGIIVRNSISLIFGILVSTVLTLVVIPVLYYALYWRRTKTCIDPSLPQS